MPAQAVLSPPQRPSAAVGGDAALLARRLLRLAGVAFALTGCGALDTGDDDDDDEGGNGEDGDGGEEGDDR